MPPSAQGSENSTIIVDVTASDPDNEAIASLSPDLSTLPAGNHAVWTPGAVVYRSDVFELIQYAPQTTVVQRRPLLIVPPQINRYYATDLSPGRSFTEFAVRSGVQTFCISWRNPTAAQREWNVETYLTACKEAIAVAREITGADRVNAMAACAGGFTLATLLGHLAAAGDECVGSATLLVTVLDTEAPTMLGQFASKTGVAASIEKSRRQGVLEGSEMARVFAWLRPNDLVWLFVANNWVMGKRPPAFDILYWNSDTTRLPAEFHADLLRMFMDNPLKTPGSITALGTAIDMSKVQVPAYVVAGITDHITPWQACYQSKNILRGKIDFVLSSSGHIQSIVNPPTNPKAKYFLNSSLPESAEDWLSGASEHPGAGGITGPRGIASTVAVKFRHRIRPAVRRIPQAIRLPAATSTRDDPAARRIHRSRRHQPARRHAAR